MPSCVQSDCVGTAYFDLEYPVRNTCADYLQYSSGVATIAWIGTELIPLEVRAVGTMLNTVTCWSTNIIIASTFLSMMKGITPSGAFGFYAAICFVGWLFVLFCFPECKGMPLESIREVFAHGFGVRYAKRWQTENKDFAKMNTQVSFAH
jgi:MFS transporter, SP family, solute carrier family 2 (myo-inositol transporter), member 13